MKRKQYDFEALIRGLKHYIGISKLRQGMSFKEFDSYWKAYGLDDTNLSVKTEKDTYRRLTHNIGGGKDFERDKQHRAKNVVRDFGAYQEFGADRSDIEGIDTPSDDLVKLRVKYNIPVKINKKSTYGREESFFRKKKKVDVIRGKNGQFAKRL